MSSKQEEAESEKSTRDVGVSCRLGKKGSSRKGNAEDDTIRLKRSEVITIPERVLTPEVDESPVDRLRIGSSGVDVDDDTSNTKDTPVATGGKENILPARQSKRRGDTGQCSGAAQREEASRSSVASDCQDDKATKSGSSKAGRAKKGSQPSSGSKKEPTPSEAQQKRSELKRTPEKTESSVPARRTRCGSPESPPPFYMPLRIEKDQFINSIIRSVKGAIIDVMLNSWTLILKILIDYLSGKTPSDETKKEMEKKKTFFKCWVKYNPKHSCQYEEVEAKDLDPTTKFLEQALIIFIEIFGKQGLSREELRTVLNQKRADSLFSTPDVVKETATRFETELFAGLDPFQQKLAYIETFIANYEAIQRYVGGNVDMIDALFAKLRAAYGVRELDPETPGPSSVRQSPKPAIIFGRGKYDIKHYRKSNDSSDSE